MTVLSCKLREEGSKLSIDSQFRRSYTHEFLIETDSQSDYQPIVYLGAQQVGPFPLPLHWSTYQVGAAFDQNVYLQQVELNRYGESGSRYYWLATCTWSPPEIGYSGNSPNIINPLQRPIRYSLEWANYTRIVDRDIFGNAIVNSAGDLFEAIEMDDARPVLVAVRNEWPLEGIIARSQAYKNAVNTDSFYGAPARHAKMESIVSGELHAENGFDFYSVTYRIQFNNEPWDLKVVDRGRQVLRYTNFEGAKVKEWPRVAEGEHAGEFLDIVNLNSDGTQREDTLPALFKLPAYRIYPELPFSELGI